MKKCIGKTLICVFMCSFVFLAGCTKTGGLNESETSGVSTDYPAAIMVDDTIYLHSMEVYDKEITEDSIAGYTSSYTDSFPEKDGETNFNRELNMPYAIVENGVVVYYEEKWYLCTPK